MLDEEGKAVGGALVDVWQAKVHGGYDHEADPNPTPLDPNFQGWARFTTDAEGRYRFKTIRPGAYAVSGEWTRPPHIHFIGTDAAPRPLRHRAAPGARAGAGFSQCLGTAGDFSAAEAALAILGDSAGARESARRTLAAKYSRPDVE